jgi:hypothetical protein
LESDDMTYFIFYERTDAGVVEVARLEGGLLSGSKADRIMDLLTQGGFPGVAPDRILHGSRLWAERGAL